MSKCSCELAVGCGDPTWHGKGGNKLLGNSDHRDNVEESKIYLSAFFFPP